MRRLPLLLALALIAPFPASSQAPPQPLQSASADPHASLFVGVEWLAQHLRDPNLVLLHVGDPAAYPAAHIPGARLVNLADISVGDRTGRGLALEMPSADTLRARLAALGIGDDSRIVLYYGKDWVSPTTRVHLTLAYAGLDARASILDGGMDAWTAAGHSTTAEIPAPAVGTLSALRVRNFVVAAAYVQSMIGRPGVSIVDARDTAFYIGSRSGGGPSAPHRAGHIAGARSVPFSTLTDASLRLKSPAELAAAFAAAGVGPRDVIIGYCHIGQQATAMLTAARVLGHPILLYDGSFQDWSARAELPVETGAAKPKD